MEKIREIKIEQTDYSQTVEDKLEVFRLKINSVVKLINKNIEKGIFEGDE